MMVPYAGKDPNELPFSGRAIGSGLRSLPAKRERCLAMFRNGKDTLDISKALGVREKTALRWVTEDRCKRLGLPDPYARAAT